MATATKLPSGNYCCKVWDKYKQKQIYFTDPLKKEAERKANLYKLTLKPSSETITFEEGLNLFIESRAKLNKSASTIANYKRNASRHYGPLKKYQLSQITDEMIQNYINELSAEYSPKTVKNLYSMITSVYNKYCPERRLHAELPSLVKPHLYLPSENDVQELLRASEGTSLCVPIYLAAFGALRRGEIVALDMDHINVKTREIAIEFDVVEDENGKLVKKNPKTLESHRIVTVPQIVIDKIVEYGLPEFTPNKLSKEFSKLLKRNNLPHFRLHDLRHFCAAKMLSIPLPLSSVKKYGGWESDEVLLQIYNYELEEARKNSIVLWDKYVSEFNKKSPLN